MLMWCSYCQQFQGENPPYEKFAITHGLCPACVDTGLDLTERDLAHARTLKGIHGRLMEAGLCADLKAAEQIVGSAADANVRGTDLMMGVIAPILFEIGEDWKRGVVTVADEHRFTGFCEAVFELVSARVKTARPSGATTAEQAEFMLVNASGNRHMLAIRILELWLVSKGARTRVVDLPPGVEDLVALVRGIQPESLLVSMALAEQRTSVVTIAERIAALPDSIRPRMIVGGYAIKMGLVQPIPGADLMADINAL